MLKDEQQTSMVMQLSEQASDQPLFQLREKSFYWISPEGTIRKGMVQTTLLQA